jgi:hypothetical protein
MITSWWTIRAACPRINEKSDFLRFFFVGAFACITTHKRTTDRRFFATVCHVERTAVPRHHVQTEAIQMAREAVPLTNFQVRRHPSLAGCVRAGMSTRLHALCVANLG